MIERGRRRKKKYKKRRKGEKAVVEEVQESVTSARAEPRPNRSSDAG